MKNKEEFIKSAKTMMYKIYHQYAHVLLGGGKNDVKITKIEYDGELYYFEQERDGSRDLYTVTGSGDDHKCVFIIVDKKTHIACIQNISGNHFGCPNGSILLNISIKFLKEHKNELKIKKVILVDSAQKACFGKNIQFCDMYTLLYGKTWYMRNFDFGKISHAHFSSKDERMYMQYKFYPYDSFSDSLNEQRLAVAYKNFEIMKNAKVKDIPNLNKYIHKYGTGFDVKNMMNIVTKMKDEKVTKFIKFILAAYDKQSCTLFYNIYQRIMRDLKVESMYGESFYMDL